MGGIDSSEASDGSHLCHFAFTALYREKMATRSPPSFGEWLWQQHSAKSMREPAGQLYRDHSGESILATDGGGEKAALWLPLRNRAARHQARSGRDVLEGGPGRGAVLTTAAGGADGGQLPDRTGQAGVCTAGQLSVLV